MGSESGGSARGSGAGALGLAADAQAAATDDADEDEAVDVSDDVLASVQHDSGLAHARAIAHQMGREQGMVRTFL